MVDVNNLLQQIVSLISSDVSKSDSYADTFLQFLNGDGEQSQPESNGYFQNPIKVHYECSGIFGVGDKRHNGVHNGVDLRAPGGTSVYPIADGIVVSVSSEPKGGNVINIKHSDRLSSIYRHMGTVSVYPNQKVSKNTIIGTVGDSGNAAGTSPHLHLEIKKDGVYQDPKNYVYVPTPSFKLKPGEKSWLSDEAKQEAHSFNMNEHLTNRNRIAFSIKVKKIEKIADEYYRITKNI